MFRSIYFNKKYTKLLDKVEGLTAKSVNMVITSTSCSQIICQKSEDVSSSGACVAMYHQTRSPKDN